MRCRRCAAATRARPSSATTERTGSSSASGVDTLRRSLVADWWASGDPAGAVMIAQRRVDVADLNGRAHALMRAAGALGEQELVVGDVAFARRRPGRSCGATTAALGVVNGDRGVVVAVDPALGRIDVDARWPAGLAAARLPRAARRGMAAAR